MRNAVTNATVAKCEMKTRSIAWPIIMIVVLIAGLAPAATAQIQILKTDFTNPSPPFDLANDKDWASKVCGGHRFLHNAAPIFEWGPVFGDEFDTQLVGLSGTIPFDPTISGGDLPFTHPFGTDWEFFIVPDGDYAPLLSPSNGCTSFTDSGACVNNIDFTSSENAKNSDCTDAGVPDKCCTAPGAGSCNINEEFRDAVKAIMTRNCTCRKPNWGCKAFSVLRPTKVSFLPSIVPMSRQETAWQCSGAGSPIAATQTFIRRCIRRF